jgi:hypothetical protein
MNQDNAAGFGRTRAAVLSALALLAFSLVASRAYAADADPPNGKTWSPPLKYPERHFESLYPVVEYHDTADASQFFFRPIYSRRNDKFNRVVESDLLWPFIFGTERPDLRRLVIFPLFVKDTMTEPNGDKTSRTVLLPLYYRKSVEQDGVKQPGTFFVFPFGGVIRNFLGRDRILVVLWPLYVKQQRKEATSWSVLHPIFTYVRWKDGGRGYKFWPLFGINRRPGRMRALFVLWPIYHDQWAKTEAGEYRRWWIWPFYGRIDEPGGWEWDVLWPFFSGRHENAADETIYWYPWPFLGHRTGPERGGIAVWPIYKSMRGPARLDVNFLWPFGWYRRETPPDTDNVSFRIFPLMFYQRERSYPGPGKGARRASENQSITTNEQRATESGGWQAWPLIRQRWERDGSGDLEVPSLFPMRNYGPWERNFAPLFRVFEYHRKANGARSWGFLWRLARMDRGPKESYTALRPLFSVRSRADEAPGHRWNVLGGLLGRERDAEGVRWRVLYFIKWRTSRAAEAGPAAAEQ